MRPSQMPTKDHEACEPNAPFSVEFIDGHLEKVLVASGSSLRHYSMQSTKDAMREAMSNAMQEAITDHEARQ